MIRNTRRSQFFLSRVFPQTLEFTKKIVQQDAATTVFLSVCFFMVLLKRIILQINQYEEQIVLCRGKRTVPV
jgi:hypothetical protein